MSCNGYNTIGEIAKSIGKQARLISQMLSLAETYGIVAHASEVSLRHHEDGNNPIVFASQLSDREVSKLHDSTLPWSKSKAVKLDLLSAQTDLLELLNQRRSCRNFIPGEMEIKELHSLLSCTYSRYSVPSAGDLRPIMPYLYLFQAVSEFSEGLYEYRWQTQELARLEVQPTSEQLRQIFPEEHLFCNSLCLLVLAADADRVTSKYGNRGYRYAVLEAGHAAQNVYLWGTESHFGVLEYGGYLDRELEQLLDPQSSKKLVLTTLFVGKPSSVRPQAVGVDTSRSKFEKLSKQWQGKRKIVSDVRLLSLPDQLSSRSYATAQYVLNGEGAEQTAWGNGSNLYEAKLKALAEGVERYYSGMVHVERQCSADELDGEWLDPRAVAPLSSRQYRLLQNLQPFDPSVKWQWVEGRYWKTGHRVWTPIDLVYYPIDVPKYGRKLCCYATSNGVSAHVTTHQAVENALLELIERNAFVLAWYLGQSSLVGLDVRCLLESPLAGYVESYAKQGVEVSFLQINLDGKAPVVVCLMREQGRYGKLGIGAGASFTSCNDAAEKAFYEAECVWLTQPEDSVRIKSAKLVRLVSDHSNYYQRSARQRLLQPWFPKQVAQSQSFEDSLDGYNPIVVNLAHSTSLQVVRVIEPSLVPLSFGYGQEYYLHQTFQKALNGGSYRFPGQPHCFV
jgi:thiazole/oxazole-forming peptide maturase SagD family component